MDRNKSTNRQKQLGRLYFHGVPEEVAIRAILQVDKKKVDEQLEREGIIKRGKARGQSKTKK